MKFVDWKKRKIAKAEKLRQLRARIRIIFSVDNRLDILDPLIWVLLIAIWLFPKGSDAFQQAAIMAL